MSTPHPEKKTAGKEPRNPRESAESIETFPLRTKRPGRVGLANEARPGLGTRGDEGDPGGDRAVESGTVSDEDEKDLSPANQPRPPEPRHPPAEQDSNSLAQEEQRSTGVSGQSSGT